MTSTYKTIGQNQGGGDPHVMKLKESNKVRPLDNVVAGWRQHGVEHQNDPEQFTSVVCPGARTCPLDRKPVDAKGKQRFPISRRYAANVWDYDTKEIKVLIGGPKIFDAFKEAATVGIDPAGCDWTIIKSGSGLKTDYQVIRHDASPFTERVIEPSDLHSVDKYEMPDSTEQIFEKLEKAGIDYDALETPSYTVDQALAFVMPYTKHKGLTIEQLVSGEQDYALWMHGTKLENGQLGDPVFLALQTVLEDRGLVPSLDDAVAMLPSEDRTAPDPADSQPAQSEAPAAVTPVENMSSSSANLVKLIGPDGNEVAVPSSAVDTMLQNGFTRPEPEPTPTTANDANAPTDVMIGGNKVTLPRAQALALIDAGTAQAVTAEEAPKPPSLPLPDEDVEVNIGGTVVSMPYVQAAGVVDNPASGANFVDSGVAEAHARSNKALESALNSSTATPDAAPEATETVTQEDDKQFACDECTARYKTQGALTQHKNREHKAATPQPSSVPAATNGNEPVRERVKALIVRAPFARDFTKLQKMFEEEVGEKNFMQMNDEQLEKVAARIELEIEMAAK